jgi:hypothetical protein
LCNILFAKPTFQSAPLVLPLAVNEVYFGSIALPHLAIGKLEQCAPQKSERIRAQLRVRVDQWVVDMPEGLDRGEGESVKVNLNSAQSRRMA